MDKTEGPKGTDVTLGRATYIGLSF